jgi:hypothetical protein
MVAGTAKVLNRIDAPWKSYYFIEKSIRNQWNRALLDRRVPDFCKGLDNPKEPWYRFTSLLNRKECPFEAGWNQTIEHGDWGQLSPLVTYNFIGKYRVTFYSYFKLNGKEHTDCVRNQFDIVDF